MPGIRDSTEKRKRIQVSKAYGFGVLLTRSGAVTLLDEGAVTWVWGANAKFQGEAGADWFSGTLILTNMFLWSGGVQLEMILTRGSAGFHTRQTTLH